MGTMSKSDERNISPRTKSVIFLDEVLMIVTGTQAPAYQLAGSRVESCRLVVSYAHPA
jgi:hypothetical protein